MSASHKFRSCRFRPIADILSLMAFRPDYGERKQRVTLSTRYGLAGIGALGLLATVHWLRDLALPSQRTGDYLLGILPNFAAAIAITFVLLSIWSDQNRNADFESAKRPFIVSALISCVGLLSWEFFQTTSNRLIFDPHDLGATVVGVCCASILFYVLTPRPQPQP